MFKAHFEKHYIERISWLRAAVLGANDGIISTSSLLLGMIASGANFKNIIIAGVAGLVAGAFSMAAGEYISVSSQKDTEGAALKKEMFELTHHYPEELKELTEIYIQRGLDPQLAAQVAKQLMEKDAFLAHARDELGFLEQHQARPLQAALFSAISFSLGSFLPLLLLLLFPIGSNKMVLAGVSLLCLAILGATSAKLGEANYLKAIFRVVFWGSLALASSIFIGSILGLNI
jgi:VIT1/CCC1 family predicted Fe2+/Mn2+ transporter